MRRPSSTEIDITGVERPKKTGTSPKGTKTQLRRESERAASARYRLANRDKVLAAGRLRAAQRRSRLWDDDDAKRRAREASARYRSREHETLALKQRQRSASPRSCQPLPTAANQVHYPEIPAPCMAMRAEVLQDWAAKFVAKRRATAAAAPMHATGNLTGPASRPRPPSRPPSPRSPSPSPDEYEAGAEADDEGDY
ncbi:hypothetical protein K438DRAFT_1975126 [Mycena galopus ATCC 62051]|nr:hypothetical protein K438DRAFT_1975126 [Mycena galopus ATCC 62051]